MNNDSIQGIVFDAETKLDFTRPGRNAIVSRFLRRRGSNHYQVVGSTTKLVTSYSALRPGKLATPVTSTDGTEFSRKIVLR